MSGLSFVSRVPGSGSRPPALSGSSVSSAPDDHHHHHRHHSFGSISFPNSDSHYFQNNSLPPSPSSQVPTGNWRYLPKPPGLSGASNNLKCPLVFFVLLSHPRLFLDSSQNLLWDHSVIEHTTTGEPILTRIALIEVRILTMGC